MPAYLTPGVYLRPRRTEQVDVRLVRTDVAAFIGYTERGPLEWPDAVDPRKRQRPEDLAIRLSSWDEYRAVFGGITRHGLVPLAVRGFFENQGMTCYVLRVAAVRHPDRSLRARTARWVFRGESDPIGTGSLSEFAPIGATSIRTSLALDVAAGRLKSRTTPLVEIFGPGGSEFHVLAGATAPDRLYLSGSVRRSFEEGTTVRLLEGALEIAAMSAGNWGNRIRLDVAPLAPGATTEFSLRVRVEPGSDRSHPREQEFYPHLSLDRRDEARRSSVRGASDTTPRRNPLYAPDHISRSRLIQMVYPPSDADAVAAAGPPGKLLLGTSALATDGLARVHLAGGQDGLAALAPQQLGALPLEWIAALERIEAIDEVAVLCAPDLVFEPRPVWRAPATPAPLACAPPQPPPAPDVIAQDPTAQPPLLDDAAVMQLQNLMLTQCERRRDRVAIIDPPARARAATTLLQWRQTLASIPQVTRRFAATYAPWIVVSDPTDLALGRRRIPPSGHIAGVYAQIDNSFGVQRPPANVAIAGVVDVADPLTGHDQEGLNPRGLNVLRAFPGRGVRVWGARSLCDEPEWRFIHVRRLMSMIEESVEDSMQWAVFEPNDESLRRTLVHSLSVFLRGIWDRGGLKGKLPEEAFYVRCDETNNPPSAVDAGQIICTVGVAPAAPMEFLVFEIRQRPEGAAIVEL
jgi:phage tail sheath protein FI